MANLRAMSRSDPSVVFLVTFDLTFTIKTRKRSLKYSFVVLGKSTLLSLNIRNLNL